LRYDPDTGRDVELSCSAAGHAWLSTLEDDDAIALLTRQGLASPAAHGPNAPTSIAAVMKAVKAARAQGYATAADSYAPGLSAVCCVIRPPGKGAVGVLAISGPSVRLTPARMKALAPALQAAAAEIALVAAASPLMQREYARRE
jgi:DNA-binding IclR family transcriptional regulator